MADVAKHRSRGPPAHYRSSVDRALDLIHAGQLSRATSLLTSKGIADASDVQVIAQLASKHVPRNQPIGVPLADHFPAATHIALDLTETYRRLRPKAGVGPDGLRNEHLACLAWDFSDCPRAANVMPLVNDLESAYVAGTLPTWYYSICAASLLVPLIKKPAADASSTPDCRPIGMPGCRQRATGRAFAAAVAPAVADHCWPVQVGVGVPNGTHLLSAAIRAMLEQHPDFIVVKIDEWNSFNCLERGLAVDRCLAAGGLIGALGLFALAYLAPEADIILGHTRAPFRSANGGRQGSPTFPAVHAVATLPEVLAADKSLSAVGGCARFYLDDGYLVGPAAAVLDAVAVFEKSIEARNGRLQRSKCVAYCPRDGPQLLDRPEVQPFITRHHTADGQPFRALSGIPVAPDGLTVVGVPVGTRDYVTQSLDASIDEMCTQILTVQTALSSRSRHALFTLTHACLAPKADYLAQTVYPEVSAAGLRRFDRAIALSLQASLGSAGPLVERDPIACCRVALPFRLKGLGCRARADLAPAAFVATVCACIPRMLDRSLAAGGTLPGFCQPLVATLGAGSFDDARLMTRFAGLLASASPLALALRSAWTGLAAEVASDEVPGPLDAPLAAAGIDMATGKPISKLQRAVTQQRERVVAAALEADIRRLPDDDRRKPAYLCADRLSTSGISAWPTPGNELASAIFAEAVANYLGLTSPACLPFVGRAIHHTTSTLDAYGSAFFSDTRLINRDASRAIQHDTLLYALAGWLREAGIQHTVEPRFLFLGCVPATAAASQRFQNHINTATLVPDLAIAEPSSPTPDTLRLAELKTISYGTSRYPPRLVNRRRAGASSPVDHRQSQLPAEYAKHAKYADEQVCGVPSTATSGPFRDRLAEFGSLLGLVVGSYGEGSDHLHGLIGRIATRIGVDSGLREGAPSVDAAIAAQRQRLYRSMGVLAHRARAQVVLSGLKYVHGSAAASFARDERFRRMRFAERQHAYRTACGPDGARPSSRGGPAG